ncbi:MAG: hypothetical protein KGM44_02860 [bacterium]|nr:hypothetical protein [bacterium]
MIERRQDLFRVLAIVQGLGGNVLPDWDRVSDRGVTYNARGEPLDDRDLESLVQSDHLERIFMDRISRCPWCRSHALNMREVCVSCKSPRIVAVQLLHHFRCGYVAPEYEFTAESDGRRCPKCHGMLRDRGTDHDAPGPHFTCQSCDSSFQVPEIGAVCLGCGRQTHSDDLQRIIYEDVYGYKLSPLGAAALRAGSLQPKQTEQLTEFDLPLLRRSVFMAFLDDERKRRRRFHSTFNVLLVTTEPPVIDGAAPDERALIETIAEFLTETDKLGRLDECQYLVLLPSVDSKTASALARKLSSDPSSILREWKLQAQVVVGLLDGAPTPEGIAASLRAVLADG